MLLYFLNVLCIRVYISYAGFGNGAGASDAPISLLHNRTQSTLTELISHILSIVECKENVGIGSIMQSICKSYNDKTSVRQNSFS